MSISKTPGIAMKARLAGQGGNTQYGNFSSGSRDSKLSQSAQKNQRLSGGKKN
jgi:hypothetical protein